MDTKAIRQQLKQLRDARTVMQVMGNYDGSLDPQIKTLNAMLRQVNAMKVVTNFAKN